MVTTSKQDRGSVKTASDLEQKYDLASIGIMKVAIANSEVGLNKTNTTLEEFMSATVKSLEDLQDQVDGNITTWFFNSIPTLENAPANEWTTEEDKINHLGDLYYDQDTGYAYRFSMVNNAYEWAKITDNDVVEALALANSAQDTADSKRRVFVSTPVPPYDSGDLWLKDSEIYICQISKDKDQVYAEKDFIIATKYTDDTYAKQVGNELKVLSGTVTTIKEGVDQFEVDITTRVDGLDEDLTVAQTDLEMVQGQISAKVWQADIDIEKSTSASSGAQILLTDSADGKVIDFSVDGRSEQNGTPTPDNPIEIVSVGDKGYFDGELLQGYYNSSTGAYATNNANAVCSKNAIPCSEGDSIKVVYRDTVEQIRITYYNNGAYATFNVANNVSEYTFTVPTNATEFHISVIANSETTPTTAKHISVTINGMYALEVKSCGKNLLENTYNTRTLGGLTFTKNNDGSVIVSGTTTGANNYFFADGRTLKKGTYTISGMGNISASGGDMVMRVYDRGNGRLLANLRYGEDETQLNITEDLNDVDIYINFNTVGITYSGTIFPMLRFVEVEDDTYEPYKETVTYIPLTEPLRSVGDVKDEIVKQDGVWGVLRRIANVVIDENSTMSLGTYQGYNRFSVTLASKYASVSPFDEGYCTHMRYSKDVLGASTDDNTISVYTTGTIVVTYFRMDKFTTVDELKSWLAENPITVQYELATETFEPFADQTPFRNITTYNPVTYITNSDDAQMEVEYYRNSFNGQTLANTSAELEMKIGRDENNQIVSMINASADEINLKSNRFSLESDNTTITKDGKITTKELNANGGEIGGWTITENSLEKTWTEYDFYTGKHYTYRTNITNGFYLYYLNSEGLIEKSGIIKVLADTNRGQNRNLGLAMISDDNIVLRTGDEKSVIIEGNMVLEGDFVTANGTSFNNKLNSTTINIDSSNTKTVRITVPSGFYIEGIYANRTYYILPSPLMYFDSLIAAYGGNTIPYAIGGVVNAGNNISLITSVMTPNTSSNYAVLPTVNSVSISNNVLTISLKLPTTSSIMSLNSNIKIV